ncbi:hypothetical protein LOTGIDRAFT_167696 [Lottia gigantea]|uniref:Uncharacterized protein n=1 Tax=Lottia gigantea TaxID=225164 RepID=V3ZY92_LOTGI|nr:hypothetical protein LOTGIDRAFT_167696 [Lottia gigantea]ESO85941.1 hypothetical protein LOTGIDRAFT_167696 [Lottia gigantea]
MLKDILITILLLGIGQVLSQHRKRQSHPISLFSILGWRDPDSEHSSRNKNNILTPPSPNERKYDSFFWSLRWANNPEILSRILVGKRFPHNSKKLENMKRISNRLYTTLNKEQDSGIRKRQDYNCDTTRITIQTIIEYLRTGRICGFRVSTMRFGLGRRR